ncbi:coiled-coil domain-containing protein 191 [Solea solea]|uniref:coiled-coil domain-containing protein 191 n=1 Tax=Solea solea TaxID=90069 RepID=UPI00272BBAF2|nr:coiled-coil domain-containing protein 191 [Solea solea]
MMTSSGHNPDLFKWRSFNKSKTSSHKVHVKNGDIDQWSKRVESASEFAVSEVFSHKKKKPSSGSGGRTVPLQSCDQLRDHDDAYSEAQALLGDWLSSKLRLELEMDDEDDLMCSTETEEPAARSQPTAMNYDNFNDLYNCLAEDNECSTVNHVLQDLMEQELLDSGMMEELALDVSQTRKKFRDPLITMEARHQQVRENRAQRDAERQRQQREREVQRAAREEAKKRERAAETRRKQELSRQEEMVQQEMVRLRRQMEQRRGLKQLVRQREVERKEGQTAASDLSVPTLSTQQKQQQQQQRVTEQFYKEQKIQTVVHMNNLKFLQRHFSAWYSAVLDRRLRMGKAMALSDWKRQLRAWRGWRTVVWAEQKQRAVVRTEEELRTEHRQCQLAVESDRRRLLHQCLNEWQRWCWVEREQRELLAQQQETRRKMAALINAASMGNLRAAGTSAYQPIMSSPEALNQPETTEEEVPQRSATLTPNASALLKDKTPVGAMTSKPTQPWQVTRRHVAPTASELHGARQRGDDGAFTCHRTAAAPSSSFENRHAAQQQIITQQRKLLKEQQEQIAQLNVEKSKMGLEMEIKKAKQLSEPSVRGGSRAKSHTVDCTQQRALKETEEPDGLWTPPKKTVKHQTCPHPSITAMEARARQRAERRKEIEEVKRKEEEEKLAEMKAAEEQREREEKEEKCRAAEKRKEEKRREREREEEKQRHLKKQQEQLKLASQHNNRALLLWRGLAPWKHLIQLQHANMQLAKSHHNLFLLRRCTLGWQQSAKESLSEKEASADQLHQQFLLRRSLSCWKRLKDWRMIRDERAERFYRTRTLRRFLLALLDHVTQERLVQWDLQELAQEHNNRRVLWRCFLSWRQLPCVLREERKKEERRKKLGQKVSEVLPDFRSYPP